MKTGRAPSRAFFGAPRALLYLTFTEAWERFSYYGMTALLTLYMTKDLFLPGHVEKIALFGLLRRALSGLAGPLTPLALASQIFGLYTALVWLTPVLGGLVADRLIGRRNAVVIGAVAMCFGHFAMAFDRSFLAALMLLIVGCGLLKGNISAQVGQLYKGADDTGRTRGFAIFSIGINVGSVAGPILCGVLAQAYGWHVGFGAAGILMLAGLMTYLVGYRQLPDVIHGAAKPRRAGQSKTMDFRPLLALSAVAFITIFQSIAFLQSSNIGLVWVDEHVNPQFYGFSIPTAWFASVGALSSIIFVPAIFSAWRWQESKGLGVGDLGKIVTGALFCTLANLVLAAASAIQGRVSPLWPIASFALQGIGFIYYWPTLLALTFRVASPALKSTLLGIAFISLFISSIVAGGLGSLYETIGPTRFWLLHGLIAFIGVVVTAISGQTLARMMTLNRASAESALTESCVGENFISSSTE
jgi:POT family proton-dependent oligopeptide transporter